MPASTDHIPPAVLDALRRGSLIEAVKLLRTSSGIGLKEAKELIDAHLRGASARSAATEAGKAKAATSAESMQVMSGGAPPAAVTEAWQRGDKVEAIRLLRAHSHMGLNQAKEAIEAMEQKAALRRTGLSPGEVRESGGVVWWIAAVVLGGLALYFYLRG